MEKHIDIIHDALGDEIPKKIIKNITRAFTKKRKVSVKRKQQHAI